MAEIRLTRNLYNTIQQDLARPHEFAFERIGFVFGKVGNQTSSEPLVLLYHYMPVPDSQYINDPKVGARIDGEAITEVMQQVLNDRSKRVGTFHVHVHEHFGKPGLSSTDRKEIPLLIPSFQSVGKEAAHGLIIFSKDHGTAWVWLPGGQSPLIASRIVVTGSPLAIFEGEVNE